MRFTPILLFLLFMVGCGAGAPTGKPKSSSVSAIDAARKSEEKAISAIKNLGGKIIFDGSGRVYSIDLEKTEITDSFLVQMKELYFLEHIRLSSTRVTDSGLVHLKKVTDLSTLWLSDCQVTDSGLENLKRMTSLKILWLNDTQVTDAGLVHLRGLTSLRELYLDSTLVTDAGVKALKASLPECRIQLK